MIRDIMLQSLEREMSRDASAARLLYIVDGRESQAMGSQAG